jgi:tetratricopeptide (TPR) repeat protein
LAVILNKRNDRTGAKQWFQRATELAARQDDQSALLRIEEDRGFLSLALGEVDEARGGFVRALEVARKLPDRQWDTVSLCHTLAELDLSQEDYESARRGFDEALQLSQSLKDRRAEMVTRQSLAALEVLSGSQTSIQPLSNAVEVVAAMGEPHLTARGLLLLAKAMQRLGDLDGAQDKLRETVALCNNKREMAGIEAEAKAALALLLAERGNPSAAREQVEAAVRFFDDQNVVHPDREKLNQLLEDRPSGGKARRQRK